MTANRKIAVTTGVLFILATAMGVINAGLLGAVLGGPDYLIGMSEISSIVPISTFLNLVMAGTIVAIAVVIYPILKRQSETLAVGFLTARTVEGTILAIGGIAWTAMAAVGVEIVQAGQSADAYFQTLGALLLSTSTLAFTFGAEIAFSISALILNYVFMRSKIVPRLISVWGFIAGFLLLILGVMKVLGMPVSAIEIAFTVPIALNEMVLAVWLIFKGFDSPATQN